MFEGEKNFTDKDYEKVETLSFNENNIQYLMNSSHRCNELVFKPN